MEIKWIQLDLARQMETMDFIKNFIALMAKAGYNGVLLYLEDRIRTKSYPYPKDCDCYTEEQIKDLVAFSAEQNMELIPCVATLGHAERFLVHPELEHLAELQGDMKGRFGGTQKLTFCPTHPDFYTFMESYLKEVAALFPSKYFHAGLDEFFDYCLCPRCLNKAPDYEAQQQLFIDHVIKIRDILAKLGKRMMMWSDMFEIYTGAIKKIPKDVFMVDWQYQPDVRFYLNHLFDCTVEDRFTINEECGLDCIVAPADFQLSNAVSILEYASNRKNKGCLVTCWEKSDAFLLRSIPLFVIAGGIMNGKSLQDAIVHMMKLVFGTDNACLTSTIKLVLHNGFWRHFSSVADNLLFSRDFRGLPYNTQEIDFTAQTVMTQLQDQVTTPLGKLVLRDMLDALREKTISHKLRYLYHNALDGRPVDTNGIQGLYDDFSALLDTMAARWDEIRPGIAHNTFIAKKPALMERLNANLKKLTSAAFAKIRICLPDGYGVQHVRVSLHDSHTDAWTQIADSVMKPIELNTAISDYFLPYDSNIIPDAIRIESYGMGGIGISWAECGKLTPKAITSVIGNVKNPEHILDNDVKFAWFGSQSTRQDYLDKARADQIHSATFALI